MDILRTEEILRENFPSKFCSHFTEMKGSPNTVFMNRRICFTYDLVLKFSNSNSVDLSASDQWGSTSKIKSEIGSRKLSTIYGLSKIKLSSICEMYVRENGDLEFKYFDGVLMTTHVLKPIGYQDGVIIYWGRSHYMNSDMFVMYYRGALIMDNLGSLGFIDKNSMNRYLSSVKSIEDMSDYLSTYLGNKVHKIIENPTTYRDKIFNVENFHVRWYLDYVFKYKEGNNINILKEIKYLSKNFMGQYLSINEFLVGLGFDHLINSEREDVIANVLSSYIFIDRFGRKYSQYKYDKDSLGFIAVYNNR